MSVHRYYFINERVKALVILVLIMTGTILLVFLGIELLKQIPNLPSDQRLYLDHMQFPSYFKLLVVLVWGLMAMFCAYLYLLYQYVGFVSRFSRFCEDVLRKDKGQVFICRKSENTNVMKDSFNTLLELYRKECLKIDLKLIILRETLLNRIKK